MATSVPRLFGSWSPPESVVQNEEPAPAAPEAESWDCGGTAHLLPQERTRASFDVRKLTFFMDGGAKATAHRRWIWAAGEIYDNSGNYFFSREQLVDAHVERFIGVHKKFAESGYQPTMRDIMQMTNVAKNQGAFGLHFGAFTNTIASQGTPEQLMEWALPAYQMKIVGCLAQTELGHGSNVRGLQTIAEYDRERQEFVLNTPTLKAMKWWPGGLGKTSTHTLVYANLIIEGKEFGFHCFLMQLRDAQHRPLPGVEVGELGPKIGDNGTETGFLRLKNVRIPRTWLLMKNQEVTPEGEYKKRAQGKKGSNKAQYLTMLSIRAGLVAGAGYRLAQGVTIATRYSCVRHQGFKDTSQEGDRLAPEMCVMDYQNQQQRLLRQLALAFAFFFTGKSITAKMEKLQESDSFEDLPELHATSSGLKALCTFEGAQGLEDCRKCCGGHGVLLIGGIASNATDYVTYNTAEGDRIVLELQSARFLVKALQEVRAGSATPPGLCSYLAELRQPGFSLDQPCELPAEPGTFRSLPALSRLLRRRALTAVVEAQDRYESLLQRMGPDEAWNASAVDLVQASRAHCWYTMFENFAEQVAQADEELRPVLGSVCALFGLQRVTQEGSDLSRAQRRAAQDALLELLAVVRPDVVPLMDAWEFPDNVLNSALGRRDGRVYEALYAGAKASPLNRSDPFQGYSKLLQPHLDLEFIAQHAKVQRDLYGNEAKSKL